MTNSSAQQDAFYQAQAILSRRDHSEYEVRTKLARKGFSEERIDDVIGKLQQLKLIDDERFARAYAASALRQKPVGPKWLANKLREKRIASEYIEPAVYALFTDEAEVAVATRAAEAWKRSRPQHAEDSERLIRFLVGRGFSYEVACELAASSD